MTRLVFSKAVDLGDGLDPSCFPACGDNVIHDLYNGYFLVAFDKEGVTLDPDSVDITKDNMSVIRQKIGMSPRIELRSYNKRLAREIINHSLPLEVSKIIRIGQNMTINLDPDSRTD
jgi:hypothetical protein